MYTLSHRYKLLVGTQRHRHANHTEISYDKVDVTALKANKHQVVALKETDYRNRICNLPLLARKQLAMLEGQGNPTTVE